MTTSSPIFFWTLASSFATNLGASNWLHLFRYLSAWEVKSDLTREWVERENESNRLVDQVLFQQGNCVQDQLVQCVRMYPAHPSLHLLLYDRAVGGDLKSSSQLYFGFWINFLFPSPLLPWWSIVRHRCCPHSTHEVSPPSSSTPSTRLFHIRRS